MGSYLDNVFLGGPCDRLMRPESLAKSAHGPSFICMSCRQHCSGSGVLRFACGMLVCVMIPPSAQQPASSHHEKPPAELMLSHQAVLKA